MTVRHVCLFDIDGTLIASGGAGKAALEAALAADFGVAGIDRRLELSGRPDRAIIADIIAYHRLDPSPATTERIVASYLRHLPGSLAVCRHGRVLPGIAALLGRLGSRNDVALGLLTGNLRAGARIKLGHYGLGDYFAFGGFGDHHHCRDDVAREALQEVQSRYNGRVRPDQVWVIGDTPLDVRCARAIGARAVAVATGWHSRAELCAHAPDHLFDDLSDPAALLDAWR
jgi:phosphoglycolate phosphatase-like HAD superfamily hydrolase